MAVVPEPAFPDRGWFVAYASQELTSPFAIRPMLKLYSDLQRLGPYRELRAWVLADDTRDEEFAKWHGFELDCGPASGFGPAGQNMNLWLWRREA